MEPSNPQRTPPPGMTWLRIGPRTWAMPDAVWEHWVRRGHVPNDALILSETWTKGIWRKAGTLEVYYLFAPSAAPAGPGSATGTSDLAGPAAPETAPGSEADGLPTALWGRGLSITQILLLANLFLSAGLVWAWRSDYSNRLWAFSGWLHERLFSGAFWALLPPLFLHATAQHLLGNMVALTAAGATVEEFYGRGRTAVLYLWSGIGGALFSLLRTKEVLSVGASGAIMGLYGVILVFLLRHRSRFTARQKLKTNRVYLPLLVLALLPSIFQADLLSHVGGFLGGLLLGLFLPPLRDRLRWEDGEPSR